MVSHESTRIALSIAVVEKLIVEGGEIENSYLYGDLDLDVYMEKPTDSSGIQAKTGWICKFLKSMYGLKKAGKIWGSMLLSHLTKWGFHQTETDPRFLICRRTIEVILLIIVVDNMMFITNSAHL